MLPQETVGYILDFLTRDSRLSEKVCYTDNKKEWRKYLIAIEPCGFFNDGIYGEKKSEPRLPLPKFGDTPLLFGKPDSVKIGNTLVVKADIIASAYYLMSRYEEMIHPNERRDKHERYTGAESLPARAGFINRPIIEEYGRLLRNWLRECGIDCTEPEAGLDKIYLTHDVDTLAYYRHCRGMLGGLKRIALGSKDESLRDIMLSRKDIHNDPAYTFDWIRNNDSMIPKAEKIYFIKAGDGRGFDYPQYSLENEDFNNFIKELRESGAKIGLHTSYAAGQRPESIHTEKLRLERALGTSVTLNRYHYLRTTSPADFQALADAGVKEDFTMAYPDIAGFRLGTCRAVRWINPATKKVTSLLLHPLTVMDCTLSDPNYMNLSYDQALEYVNRLIDTTKRYNGEISLLWHNTSVSNEKMANMENFNHRQLYSDITASLKNEI